MGEAWLGRWGAKSTHLQGKIGGHSHSLGKIEMNCSVDWEMGGIPKETGFCNINVEGEMYQ